MYESGKGVNQSKAIALEWYTEAARQGNKDAIRACRRL
jgi:TPR repeat protein